MGTARGAWRATWSAVRIVMVVAICAACVAVTPVRVGAVQYSCDEAGLDDALLAGGTATFNCAAATTITVGGTKTISVSGTILDGGGLLTLSGGGMRQVLQVTATAELRNLTITGGSTASFSGGGGIANGGTLTITNCTISGNSAPLGVGGGIANFGTLTVNGSTISGNTATGTSGTVGGGGIISSGPLNITNSTVSGNSASGASFAIGGGLALTSTATITNSTVSGNTIMVPGTATEAGGAGIAVFGGSTTLTNVTVAGNTTTITGMAIPLITNGGLFAGGGTTTLLRTIVAGNTSPSTPDVSGTGSAVSDSGFNLIGSPNGNSFVNGTNNNRVGTTTTPLDPQLGPLANNGGLTLTRLPFPNSPAVNAGGSTCPAVPTDQRGVTRPQGTACDIGAVEFAAFSPVFVAPGGMGSGTSAASPLGSISLALTVVTTGGTVNVAAGSYAERVTLDRNVTIVGAGATTTTVNGGMAGRTLTVSGGVTASISGMTITGGKAPNGSSGTTGGAGSDGGGILNGGTLTLTDSIVRDNAAGNGGSGSIGSGGAGGSGGAISTSGTLTATRVTFSGNVAGDGGNGIPFRNVGGGGGAISNSGTLTLTSSTLSGNTAGIGTVMNIRDAGGAILTSGGTVTLTNVTVSGNTGRITTSGGGIEASGGTVRLTNVTITANSTGGINVGGTASATVAGSIISGNSGVADVAATGGGSITDNGANLIGIASGAVFTGPGTQTNVPDPKLNALADNGGPTKTHLPRLDSPALDGGSATCPTPPGAGGPLAADQRGQPRGAVAGPCDIGAVEVAIPGAPLLGSLSPVGTAGQRITLVGVNFRRSTTVTVDGVAADVTGVSADGTRLSVTLPTHAAGAVPFVASNPGVGNVSTFTLTYVVPNAAPTPHATATPNAATTATPPMPAPTPARPTAPLPGRAASPASAPTRRQG